MIPVEAAVIFLALVGAAAGACIGAAAERLTRRPRLSGTIVMNVVRVPDGYTPPSAAVMTPRPYDWAQEPDL